MKASIYNIEPFDATKGTTIKFSWAGKAAKSNKLKIVEFGNTSNVIYDYNLETTKLEHTINLSKIKEGKTLSNGKKYIAYITVYYDGGNSTISSGKSFLCFTTPTFELKDAPKLISSSSWQFNLNYAQKENEPLDAWKITVYDSNYKELSTTGLQYDTTNLSHSFYGFASGYRYIVRGYGKTVNGMNLTTDEVVINVDYNVEEIFSKLDLTNIKNKAAILIDSNIVRADGESKKAVTYIDGEWADLKSNYVIYDGGFLLDGDFSLIIYVKGLTRNTPFFDFYSAYNKDFHGALTYRVGNAADNADGSFYGQFELRITDKNKNGVSTSYIIYTDRIPKIYDSTIVGLCIVRSNGLYSLQMLNMSSTNTTSEEAI